MALEKSIPRTLSVIVPAYNEAVTIEECIRRILEAQCNDLKLEVVVSDNLSTDGTQDKLAKINDPRVKVVLREKHSGKGANVRTAFEHATGDIILIQDADLEYNPNDYPDIIRPFFEADADVVYGSRLTGAKYHRVFGVAHLFANKILTLAANVLFNGIFTDIETATKAFRREVIQSLNLSSEGFEIEPEITAKIMKNKKLKVFEVPVSHAARTYEEGKKVHWWHFFTSLWALVKWRFIS